MPRISIVIPVYNTEQYLKECLDSLIRQTMRDIELICVNDGSTDGSRAILAEYAEKDERIRLIDQPNSGYGRAMNTGIDQAAGEYIGIVEPDDYVSLTMFEDLYSVAATDDLDLVKADYLRFVSNLKAETRTFKYTHLSDRQEDYRRVFKPRDEKGSFFFVMNTWSGIYRKDFLQKYAIRHNETPGASYQDNGFWFQTFLYAERAMILDIPCYRVRRDNPNSSIRDPEKVMAMSREYDYIRGILEKDEKLWEEMKEVYWRLRIRNHNATMNRIAPEKRKEFLKEVRQEILEGISKDGFCPEDFSETDFQLTKDLERGRYIQVRQYTDEAERLRDTAEYRIGRAVMWLPRKMRDAFRFIRT